MNDFEQLMAIIDLEPLDIGDVIRKKLEHKGC
jgi:hypothetical protein